MIEKMGVYDLNGLLLFNAEPYIRKVNGTTIIHIHGFCEYYYDNLKRWLDNNPTLRLNIDVGKGWFVKVPDLIEFLNENLSK